MDRDNIKPDAILDRSICGFRVYALGEAVHVTYASKNLCDLLGVAATELESSDTDAYAAHVHADDQEVYAGLVANAGEGPGTYSAQYRLVTADGRMLHTNDTLTVEMTEEGELSGYSVLADITELTGEIGGLKFLSDTVPCGFIKYTCDTTPQVTYINQKMLEILGFSEKDRFSSEYLEMCKRNIFLLVPVEERRRFGLYLKLVYRREAPIAGEMAMLRSDGTPAYLFGWVTKTVNDQGVEEFQSVCMDVTERHLDKTRRDAERYLTALSEAYDLIFEYDLGSCTVKYLFGRGFPELQWVQGIPMKMDDVTDRWIASTVDRQDREAMRAFFSDFFQNKPMPSGRSSVIHFGMQSSDGEVRPCSGQFVKIDQFVSLFCCKRGADVASDGAKGNSSAEDALPGDADEVPRVQIRTFGFFDVFVDGKPIAFRNEKSKELFALLVDRRGGFVSSSEAISFLWEDEPVSPVTLSRYRKVALRLKNILDEYAISDVVENVNGKRRLATEKVSCDLYDYLSGRGEFAQLFKGSYLSNYSWGETTLAGLLGDVSHATDRNPS